MAVRIPEHVQNLKPYKAGKPIGEVMREKGLKHVVKLASNENPLGISDSVRKVLQEADLNIHRYPEPSSFELVHLLAEKYGRKPEEVVCANGTDSLLEYILMAFMERGDTLLTSDGTFIGIFVNVKKLGLALETVPLKDYSFDLEAIANRLSSKPKVVYLANPNNPTGSMFTRQSFEDFMKKVSSDTLVILDEAYSEYAAGIEKYPDGMSYRYPNLIVTRTLSKAYGLAGLRVGFAMGPAQLIQQIYKVKLPFEPNAIAQKAACAALRDVAFVNKTVTLNRKMLKRMQDELNEAGIPFVPTAANFLLMIFKSPQFAEAFVSQCLDRGLIVRHTVAFGIPEGVRINSGTSEEVGFAMKIVRDVFASLNR